MTLPKDGGPAFPVKYNPCGLTEHQPTLSVEQCQGMSLRDWYMGQALQGLCANPAVFASNGMIGWSLVNCTESKLAGYCAYIADTMLAERNKP